MPLTPSGPVLTDARIFSYMLAGRYGPDAQRRAKHELASHAKPARVRRPNGTSMTEALHQLGL